MFGAFLGWLWSMGLAFFAGVNMGSNHETDSELQQKVQGHMDVIVDESAAIIDDVTEEVRKDERVQEAEQFVNDVKEIAQNTADDIDAHFGNHEETEAVSEAVETEAVSEAEQMSEKE